MKAEQETPEGVHSEDETNAEVLPPNQEIEQEIEQEDYEAFEEGTEQRQEPRRQKSVRLDEQEEDRSSFIHGLSVGLGIGCIATFIIVWISVFFTPQMPSAVTYENLLSIFVYPLIYLLAVGLIALTAGIVREYYATKNRF